MSKIRSYRPARLETVKSFAERLLLSLLNYLPVSIPEVHIVAHRYNGLFRRLTDTGELISLKSTCRLRRRKRKNLQISALSTTEEWDAVLASSASKSRLIEIVYETWEQMSDQLPNALNLFLSGGLKERFKVSLVKRGCCPTLPEHCYYEECLSSSHEEADQRLITHVKYASRYAYRCAYQWHRRGSSLCSFFFKSITLKDWANFSWSFRLTLSQYKSRRMESTCPKRSRLFYRSCTVCQVVTQRTFLRRRKSFFLKHHGVSNFCLKNCVCDGSDQGCRREAFSRHV